MKRSGSSSSSSGSRRCAACQLLRRKCSQKCTFAPYFPSTHPQRFSSVHKVFGASNVSKMLQELPVDQRTVAANSMFFEARERIKDPVYGCGRIISSLQHQIAITQQEVAMTRAQIAWFQAHSAAQLPVKYSQQQQQQQQQQQEQHVTYEESLHFDATFSDVVPVTTCL